MSDGTENPFNSIETAMATSSRDQSLDKRDAWVRGYRARSYERK